MRPRSLRWRDVLAAGLVAALLPTLSTAEVPSPKRQAELRHLLEQDCGSCHGLTLRGGLGPSLAASRIAGHDDDFLIDTILFGRRGTPMPPWAHELTPEDVRWLVNHLRER